MPCPADDLNPFAANLSNRCAIAKTSSWLAPGHLGTDGRRSTTSAAIANEQARTALSAEGNAPPASVTPPMHAMVPSATAFVVGRTTRFVCQSRNARPNNGERKSRSFQCGDERVKQPVANKRKGVDGRSGRKAPITASASKEIPSPRYTAWTIGLPFVSHAGTAHPESAIRVRRSGIRRAPPERTPGQSPIRRESQTVTPAPEMQSLGSCRKSRWVSRSSVGTLRAGTLRRRRSYWSIHQSHRRRRDSVLPAAHQHGFRGTDGSAAAHTDHDHSPDLPAQANEAADLVDRSMFVNQAQWPARSLQPNIV